ncbi:MAG: ABC transporter permease [Rhodospirillaceae bacterium]|jgi:peptide/nickel transport system permease protein|nr:ABC transporter permease [Rhodospirillaceae bacterium]
MNVLGYRLTLTALIGWLIILVCVGSAVLAPWIAPHDPNAPLGQRWEAPSAEHWFGLDQIGRDMFSRMLYGGRISITLAFLATCLAFAVGVVAGFAAALLGRWVDVALSRIADVILSMPILMSALIVISAVGSSAAVLILTIGLLYAVIVFRVARAVAMNIVVLEYVEAARLRGEGLFWVILREILPNALPPLAAEFGLRFSFAFLFVASLSFLGLGVQPPDADWGSMVKESALAIPAGLAAPLYPAAAIALLTIGVNMVVDWLLSLHSRPHGDNA